MGAKHSRRPHPANNQSARNRRRRAFSTNVFVNCPFDKDYRPLLRPLLFTIIYLGLQPRIALESNNSGTPRIEKISTLVSDSALAIHDLSRNRASKKGELYRLNMPFELGLDVGCQRFSSGRRRVKKCLILEAERYRYQAALSDLAGSDIESHSNQPREVVRCVRNWLSSETGRRCAGPASIWESFNTFMNEYSRSLRQNGFLARDIEALPASEMMGEMQNWCQKRTPSN